jgi:hypothetical protein
VTLSMAEAPLLRHSCLFALHRPLDDALQAELERFSARFRAAFPGITRYAFGPNRSRKAGRHVLVLYSEFVDEATFRDYVASPLHDEIVAFLEPVVAETLIGDIVC